MLDGRGLQLEFPDTQAATPWPMNGHNRPHLSTEQIKVAFNKPVGTVPLRESAR